MNRFGKYKLAYGGTLAPEKEGASGNDGPLSVLRRLFSTPSGKISQLIGVDLSSTVNQKRAIELLLRYPFDKTLRQDLRRLYPDIDALSALFKQKLEVSTLPPDSPEDRELYLDIIGHQINNYTESVRAFEEKYNLLDDEKEGRLFDAIQRRDYPEALADSLGYEIELFQSAVDPGRISPEELRRRRERFRYDAHIGDPGTDDAWFTGKEREKKMGGLLPMKSKYALGGAVEVKGPRHEQGGVPLAGKEVEGGETLQKIGRATYVFSDRLRVPGTRETFAERHKALKKEGAPERETLRLVRMQERLNGPPQSKLFLGGILGSVLKYAPAAVNLARGLFGRNETPEARLVDRGSLGYLNQMQTTVDVTPQLQEVRDQTRAIVADPAASAQHKLIAHANALRSSQSILSGKANAEAELTNQKMGALAQQTAHLDMADQQALSQNDLLRMQGDAARENILGAGLSQLSSLYQQGRADKVALAAATAQMDPADRDVLLRRLGIGMDHTNPFWQRLRTFFSGSAPMPATPALPNDFGSVVSWRAPRPKLAR